MSGVSDGRVREAVDWFNPIKPSIHRALMARSRRSLCEYYGWETWECLLPRYIAIKISEVKANG